jgi:hypothetical protein
MERHLCVLAVYVRDPPETRKEAGTGCAPPSFHCLAYLSQPEQVAQQSAEAQQAALAAFAAPAKPSAMTATNRMALMLFMDFLLFRK